MHIISKKIMNKLRENCITNRQKDGQMNWQMDRPKFMHNSGSKVLVKSSINWIERRLYKLEEIKPRVHGIE